MAALTILITPFPRPEAKYPHRIVVDASAKDTEMILSAGTPKPIMAELAENSWSSWVGKIQNSTVPQRAMVMPVGSSTFHVC